MKRKMTIGAVITALFYICVVLNVKIADPADFTGTWYHAGDNVCYLFENGIIQCADQKITLPDGTVFSGAYTFGKNKASLFVVDDRGVGEVVELHLVRKLGGDILCEKTDGRECVWFSRNKDTVRRIKISLQQV